jgi:glyceraldehyde-3-phosphate dehydrogenase/erythrose-4-phosphate dehydrogenase
MKKIRAAVVGYGNIGKSVVEALQAAPDFEIAGIIRRNGAENKPAELAAYEVVKDIAELKGYSLILDRASDAGIIFASPKADISNDVLTKLGYN